MGEYSWHWLGAVEGSAAQEPQISFMDIWVLTSCTSEVLSVHLDCLVVIDDGHTLWLLWAPILSYVDRPEFKTEYYEDLD